MLSVEDERAISATLHAYATGIDQRDWVLFRSAFADSIVADYGDFGVWTSGDAITEAMRETHAPVGPTLHRLSNIVITEKGDGATVRTYVDAVLMNPTPDMAVGRAAGMYEDVVERLGSRWVIKERRFVLVLMG